MMMVDYGDEQSCLTAWQVELAEAVGRMRSIQRFLGGTLESDMQDAIECVEHVVRSMRQKGLSDEQPR